MKDVDLSKPLPSVRRKPNEQWRKFDDLHLISNYGRWYSLRSNRLIKQFRNNSGYYRVQFRRKNHFTHIKVVEFFGDKNGRNLDEITSLFENGLSIDHIDRNKRNNAYTNLEIVTHQENCIRKYI